MHPSPIYRKADEAQNLAFARARGFGVLSINGAEAPLFSHLPFVIAEDGKSLELHMFRANPMVRALAQGALPAALVISGPDGYISPDWYGLDDQVPTWNYIAVHLRGQLAPCDPAELRGVLARLSHQFETRLAPKPEWLMGKMTPEALARLERQILPYRMQISAVEGTWKLGQNKPDAARLGAADGLEQAGIGTETSDLAQFMRDA
ncbi:MAG: FMN-binding negative transcriptional regulator [Paracoccaceae bacterium]